jgi:hypothetical protein
MVHTVGYPSVTRPNLGPRPIHVQHAVGKVSTGQVLLRVLLMFFVSIIPRILYTHIQGGSNMTGTECGLFTHNQSRSYLNHLVSYIFHGFCSLTG